MQNKYHLQKFTAARIPQLEVLINTETDGKTKEMSKEEKNLWKKKKHTPVSIVNKNYLTTLLSENTCQMHNRALQSISFHQN